MKSLRLIFLFCSGMACITVDAQTTLPGFTVKELTKGKIQVSWINPYQSCIQLAVQRSPDSTKNFRTIFSSQSPELPSNGFVDNQAPAGYSMYYRIFYVLKGGTYFFTAVKKAGGDDYSTRVMTVSPSINPGSIVRVFKKGELAFRYEYPDYIRFRDSIISKTKDSLYTIDADSIDWRPFVIKPFWKPSSYIYTNGKGYLVIHLPGVKQHHYRIVFFEENGAELFQVKTVKDPELVLDKTSFVHTGWFEFELYEDDKLKEKNKFFLDKN